MTQYSGMSFSLWECTSAREREERVWLYKILNNDLGKKCSFPFGQWPKVICIGLCDFPRRMWGPPPHSDSNLLLWSVCWVWSWPWPQLQRTFLSCTGEGRVGYAEKSGPWVCGGGDLSDCSICSWFGAPFAKPALSSDVLNCREKDPQLELKAVGC